MRGFASLLFAAALAAHLGPAGAPSLGAAPVCADEVGAAGNAGGQLLHPGAALAATQVEAATDGREPTGRPEPRRAVPRTAADAPRVVGGSSRPADACVPASLLGFSGHPTTAPPLQA